MLDPRVERMAAVLVEYSLDVQPGENMLIQALPAAESLVLEVYRLALRRGAHVETKIGLPGLPEAFFRNASDVQLARVAPLEEFVTESFDVFLRIGADANTRALSTIDPARIVMFQAAREPLTSRFLERAARRELKWCITQFPTEAYAQDAEMSLREYEDFLFTACRVNEPDPVVAWKEQREVQERLIGWLAPRRELRLLGPDTDLTLSIEGRTFIPAYGDSNFPDGEIFTGPVEDSARGHVRFAFPASAGGREIEDIRLSFDAGRVVDATAAKNEDYLVRMLDTDEGARRLGELGIGTNYGITRFTRNTLFDEKIGGTVHLAVGRSYPETGGLNRSAVHWDLVCDLRRGGEIRVDGEVFAKDGRFTV
ncbi:MAG: aminopeptidase [Gemmatimonadetes bacterium]|nr:aminopeptidase [Gemmatimonadota bacterium]